MIRAEKTQASLSKLIMRITSESFVTPKLVAPDDQKTYSEQ